MNNIATQYEREQAINARNHIRVITGLFVAILLIASVGLLPAMEQMYRSLNPHWDQAKNIVLARLVFEGGHAIAQPLGIFLVLATWGICAIVLQWRAFNACLITYGNSLTNVLMCGFACLTAFLVFGVYYPLFLYVPYSATGKTITTISCAVICALFLAQTFLRIRQKRENGR